MAWEQPNLYQYRYRFQKKKLNSSISARESDARRSGKQRDLGRLGKAHMPSLCRVEDEWRDTLLTEIPIYAQNLLHNTK